VSARDHELTVSNAVIGEMIRLAALEVPGVQRVGRAGPLWRRLFAGRSVRAHVHAKRVTVRLAIIARPGHSSAPLAAEVRAAVGAAMERLLGLELDGVTVVIDGVG
jgi:uncharacterized alkaline shock family protein YloU